MNIATCVSQKCVFVNCVLEGKIIIWTQIPWRTQRHFVSALEDGLGWELMDLPSNVPEAKPLAGSQEEAWFELQGVKVNALATAGFALFSSSTTENGFLYLLCSWCRWIWNAYNLNPALPCLGLRLLKACPELKVTKVQRHMRVWKVCSKQAWTQPFPWMACSIWHADTSLKWTARVLHQIVILDSAAVLKLLFICLC